MLTPFTRRPGLESMSDRVTLTDYEARRLLNAIVKEFVQMTAEELEQQAAEGNRYRWSFLLFSLFDEHFLPEQKRPEKDLANDRTER